MHDPDAENIEIQMLLEAVYRRYGYDFRHYARASVKRRLHNRLARSSLNNISELQHRVLHDPDFFSHFLGDFSINVTEMFRDPDFYRALRDSVLPALQREPHLKVWHAGCASGEEVYSVAILLHEQGLYERTQIYATDYNQAVIEQARQGIYPLERVREYTVNYQEAGGTRSFSDYYTADYDAALIDRNLRRNIVFSDHNLATDGVFGEMDLILCRNVMIYFDRTLQNRACRLLYDSLRAGGFLCLGHKESIRFTEVADHFEDYVAKQKIYQRRAVSPGASDEATR